VSTDIAEFISARYDEAEALAKEAGGYLNSGTPDELVIDLSRFVARGQPIATSAIVYIAMNRPQDRLADIKLKRAILAEHKHVKADWPHPCDFGCENCHYHAEYGSMGAGWCATVRQLGTEFDQHPDYREAWKP